MATHTATVIDRIVAAFNSGDVDAFAACFAEDAVQLHPFFPEPMVGREAIRRSEATMFAAFDQIQLTATSVVTSGNTVAAELRVVARHSSPLMLPDGSCIPPTGVVLDLPMAIFLEVRDDGQIAVSHRYQDSLAMLRALGLAG